MRVSTTLALLAFTGCEADFNEDGWKQRGSDTGDWTGDADTADEGDADTDADSDADADADSASTDTASSDTATDSAADTAEPDICDAAVHDAVTFYMSADDSNSQATPVLARRQIDAGEKYTGAAFPWEFLNYYDFDYAPATDSLVRLDAQMVQSADIPGDLELVAAVVAPTQSPESRAPLNLVFAVDTSGSMSGSGISMAQATMRAIAGQLKAGDVVSVVTWASRTNTVLDGHLVTGPDDADLLDAADSLSAGDSTDLSNGLNTAYDLADSHIAAGYTNRVVLISDGGANTGQTDEDLIGEHAAVREADAVYLIGVGVGDAGAYSADLMDTVTDLGRGAHVFIDSTSEAERQFDEPEHFIENLMVAATDVTLSMQLPADWVIDRFSGEQISTQASDIVPQNLAPNDQMLYHLTLRNCGGDPNAAFHFAVSATDTDGVTSEVTLDTNVDTMSATGQTQVVKAVALVDAADAIQGVWAQPSADRKAWLEAARDRAEIASATLPDDADLAEIVTLLSAYAAMF